MREGFVKKMKGWRKWRRM